MNTMLNYYKNAKIKKINQKDTHNYKSKMMIKLLNSKI